jgi:hypothetical protein
MECVVITHYRISQTFLAEALSGKKAVSVRMFFLHSFTRDCLTE